MNTDEVNDLNALIKQAQEYVQKCMSRYDTSHDYAHVQRVCRTAQTIAAAESQTTLLSKLQSLLSDLFSAPITTLRRIFLRWPEQENQQREAVRPFRSCPANNKYDFASPRRRR
jgi:hypothetical protein